MKHETINCFCSSCNKPVKGNVISKDTGDENVYFVSCQRCSMLGMIKIDPDDPSVQIYEWDNVKPITIHKPKRARKPEKDCKIPIQEDVARAIDLD